jgi:hypothetical protein
MAKMKQITSFYFILTLLLLGLLGCVFFAFYSIHCEQLSPHRTMEKIGTRVLYDCIVTNPAEVHVRARLVVGTNGLQTEFYTVTNQLWTVWSIWK